MKKRTLTMILAAMMVTGAAMAPCAVYADDTCTVTFDMNYDGTENQEQEVKVDGRATAPEDPEQEDYAFTGWFTDEECTEKFIFSTKISEDTTLYAGWAKEATFEAEDVDMSEMSGPGASGAATAKDMVVRDKDGANASNGYYVSYLFAPSSSGQYNTTLEFKINSDADVEDGKLYIRMAADTAPLTINGDEYQVEVNGALYSYDNIEMELADGLNTGEFQDYLITSNLKLNEGENVIRLIVNNTDTVIGGTTTAKAPDVDCIKIAANGAELTWSEGYPNTGNYADDE